LGSNGIHVRRRLGCRRYSRAIRTALVRRGEHAPFTPPLSLGVDGAGVVVVAGDQAIAKVGDRVAWEYVAGSYADMVAVSNNRLVHVPDGVSFEAAAGGLMHPSNAMSTPLLNSPIAAPMVLWRRFRRFGPKSVRKHGSLGLVYRWLVVLRSHSISRAVSSETIRYSCRSSELISRVFMNHVLLGCAMDFS
jgi:hypothetical protein